jgi:hypothetical protein
MISFLQYTTEEMTRRRIDGTAGIVNDAKFVDFASNFIPSTDNTFSIGSLTKRIINLFLSGVLYLTKTSNQIVTGSGSNLTTVNFPASSGAVTITMPNTTDTVMSRASTETVSGTKTFTSTMTTRELLAQSDATYNIGGPNNRYLVVYGRVFDSSFTSDQIELGVTGQKVLISATAQAAPRRVTIPVIGGHRTMAFIDEAQTVSASSNQLKLQPNGSGNSFIITASNPAADSTYTIPDVGTTANFAFDAQFPTRATMCHFQSISTSGSITLVINTGQINNGFGQSGGSDGESWSNSFFIKAGTYTLSFLGCTDADAPKIDWTMDGSAISGGSGQDWYSVGTVLNVIKSISNVTLTTGRHKLVGTVNGRNASNTTNYTVRLNSYYLVPAAD